MSKDTDRDAQRCPNDGQTLAWHLETNRDGRTNGAFLGCAFGAPSLPEFLLARLDEDEAVARKVTVSAWEGNALTVLSAMVAEHDEPGSHNGPAVAVIASPARVLADVEAKRRIVEGILDATMDGRESRMIGPFMSTDDILGLLALPFVDHPDYRVEWKP